MQANSQFCQLMTVPSLFVADKFVNYFNEKITQIRQDLKITPNSTSDNQIDIESLFEGERFEKFSLLTASGGCEENNKCISY